MAGCLANWDSSRLKMKRNELNIICLCKFGLILRQPYSLQKATYTPKPFHKYNYREEEKNH